MGLLLSVNLASTSALNDGLQVVAANQPGSLTGVQSIYLLIEPIPEEVQKNGLSLEEVREATEEQLEEAGLSVVSKAQRTSKTPILYLQIATEPDKNRDAYLYTIHLSLQQNVFLQRLPKMEVVGATTWQETTFGKVSAHSVETLMADVEDLTDLFLKAHLKANPRRQKRRDA